MSNVWDWLKSINSNKINLLEKEEDIKVYQPYIVNKALSYHWDSALFSNEMNMHPYIPSEVQYLFYLHSIKKGNRFARWVKKESTIDIELIKKCYQCNDSKAYEILNLLSKEQIAYIKNKLESCGLNK
jgi:hypothetical protein